MRKKLWALMVALSALVLSLTSGAMAAGGTGYSLQGSFAGASSAFFGYSVATDGNTAVIGAFNDHASNGAAYVYVLTGSTWSLQQVLTAPDGAANDNLGYTVALSGNTAMLGAPGKGNGQGYVYVFTRPGSTWALATEFTSSDGAANDCFGCAMALRGGTALLGANGKLGGTGGAYVFTGSGSTWSQGQAFVGVNAGEAFGYSVALTADGKTAVVGAFEFSNATGHAYVFTSSGSMWAQQAVLAASDGKAGDSFGYSVAADGNTALIGAYAASGSKGALQGEVYVFTSSAGAWSQQPKLLASDGAANDYFGYSLALSGTTALVGAYEKAGTGAAYVFANAGGTWSQQELPATGSGQSFGWSVAVSSSAAVVGAFSASNDAGAAFLFAPAVVVAAPAVGAAGSLALGVLLLAIALGSMTQRGRRVRLGGVGALALALFAGTTACSASHD